MTTDDTFRSITRDVPIGPILRRSTLTLPSAPFGAGGRRPSLHLLGALALVIAVGGCGFNGENDSDVRAIAIPGCGPTDGPALWIYVTQAPIYCSSRPAIWEGRHGEFLRIWILGTSDVATPFTMEIGGDQREGALVRRCATVSECVAPVSGTISIEESDSLGIPVVTYELVFEDGDTEAGSHAFRKCEREYICG